MSDFIETAKQKIGKGISRVSWEADKLRRTQAKQGEINTLKQSREQVLVDFSNTVLMMYRQGALTDPRLQEYCERILEIEREMTTKSAELEQIRSEMYQGAQEARPGMGDAASAASTSKAANRAAGASAGAGRAAEMAPCPTCGEPVRAKALYCNKCGARLR
ncbi:MAG TPA: zinc ribbon domain-containing protein [Ktedonobacterales bacterium]|jgi:DNA repair exonuclease SbcCD ATPase subunit